jgi:hypothetical protein
MIRQIAEPVKAKGLHLMWQGRPGAAECRGRLASRYGLVTSAGSPSSAAGSRAGRARHETRWRGTARKRLCTGSLPRTVRGRPRRSRHRTAWRTRRLPAAAWPAQCSGLLAIDLGLTDIALMRQAVGGHRSRSRSPTATARGTSPTGRPIRSSARTRGLAGGSSLANYL